MDKQAEIIIRRRVEVADEGIKSGAWKVAHADFMTAMMAFFLIMWLVNSTNEEVKVGIAQFFNPIQLTDILAESRGLNDPGPRSGSEKSEDGGGEPGPGGDGGSAADSAYPEGKLFESPYAALDTIVAEAAKAAEAAADDGRPAGPSLNLLSGLTVGPSGTQARDPFDPMSWTRPVLNGTGQDTPAERRPGGGVVAPMPGEPGKVPSSAERTGPTDGPVESPHPQTGTETPDAAAFPDTPPVAGTPPAPAAAKEAAPGEAETREAASGEAVKDQAVADRAVKGDGVAGEVARDPAVAKGLPAEAGATVGAQTGPAGAGNAQEAMAASVAENIRQLTIALADVKDGNGPLVALEAVEGGVLINLTERETRSMFGSGSASPSADLIAVIDRIAAVVKTTEGMVVVRGHTDGRPYRTKAYDNWRLSTARAHMAAYMLIRGGVPEARIDHIEGHADRKLKRPDDPGAAENRRIEILVRTPAP
ncbi:MotB family protein [Mongoliimonas terrestris]|uniref:MotB family protein n=1 Tax=Mongoliimonas terrestris TaxID=1709001 RepID=UPI0009496646|nr:MotB family protein [Mongoliimonas terrestris]